MVNSKTYLIVLAILCSITITTVLADTVTVNTYPYQIPGSSSTGLIVTSSGNVGIGTTTPGAKLEVTNQITISNANQQTSLNINGPNNDVGIQIGNTGTNGRNYQFLSSGGTSGLGQGTFTLYDATTGGIAGARLVVTSSGNVGIGTISPAQALDVIGNIRLTGNVISPNDICIGTC